MVQKLKEREIFWKKDNMLDEYNKNIEFINF